MSTENSGLLNDLQSALKQKAPLLPPKSLHPFVEDYFSRRKEYLEILEKHSPPAYLLETNTLKQKAQQFRQAFKGVLADVSFYYAVKSNNHPEVAKTLLQWDFGLDVSSGLELEMALSLGARDMVFSGPGKTDQELGLATRHSESVIVLLDSFAELHRLENIAAAQNELVRAGVRLTTDTKGLWRKFGIPANTFFSFWGNAKQCPHVVLQGLQFHTSWNLSPDAQIAFIKTLGELLAELPASLRKDITFIDIGGGYWPPQGEWQQAAGTPSGRIRTALGKWALPTADHYRLPAEPIESFAAQLGSAIKKHLLKNVDCRIFLEPGRWISNDAMHLFMSVVDKKEPDLVITDAGTNAIGWERFETDYFPILNLTRPSLIERPCDILGSLCTPHDVWGYSYWGDDIQPGDLLMIPTQGAYTYSLRQNFIKPVPDVIVV